MSLTSKQIALLGPFMHPVNDKISQKFGKNFKLNGKWFYGEIIKSINKHNGIDYSCKDGTEIYAPCDLKITGIRKADVELGYGNAIFARTNSHIEINKKLHSIEMVFGHLKEFKINLRDWIKQGEIIGISDNTGKYTIGPHLHWGPRIVQKQKNGGWLAQDLDNGTRGYFDILPFIDMSLSLKKYEGKLVYGGKQNGAKHYLVRNGKLEWIKNEVDFFISGYDFKDAISINPSLIINSKKITYKVDNNNPRVKQAKSLLDFAIHNKSLAIKYFKTI